MSERTVKFNKKAQPEFFRELNQKVNQYFKDNNISKHANANMVFKTIFMLCLYFVPWGLMVGGVLTSFGGVMFLWVLMGLGMAGIGLSVMHDANHGAYSSDKRINNLVGFVLNFTGGYPVNWKIQHNVLHHSYTNVHGFDEDIDKGVMRFSPNQERKGIYRFQVFYAPILYALLTIYWILIKDFQQLFKYDKRGLLKDQGLTFWSALFQIIFNKTWYFALFLVLPIMVVDLPWTQVVLGYLVMHFICGMILALIFQPAHVIEETDFYKTDETGSVENNWAIHQLRTTANFANGSRWFSWFIGGLNYQIEHHLFPHICHVHYRHIAGIVKQTAEKHNIPYYHHKTFAGAVISHFSLLNSLGTGKYDRERLAAAS